MNSKDQQFLQAMVYLGICDQNYAHQLVERQNQLVAQGHNLSIPRILLHFKLATEEQVQRVDNHIKDLSSRSSFFLKGPSSPKNSKFSFCPHCAKAVPKGIGQCYYCKHSMENHPSRSFRRKWATPHLWIGSGFIVLILLTSAILFQVHLRVPAVPKSPSPIKKRGAISPSLSRKNSQPVRDSHLPKLADFKNHSSSNGGLQLPKKTFMEGAGFARESLAEIHRLNELGQKFLNQGNFLSAHQCFAKTLELAQQKGYRALEARAFNNLGAVFFGQKKISQALSSLSMGAKIWASLGKKNSSAGAFCSLGAICIKTGQYSKALGFYRKALEFFREVKDQVQIATTLNLLGFTLHRWGKYKGALKYYHLSLAISQKRNLRDLEASTISNLGMVDYSLGKYPQALSLLQKALDIQRERNDWVSQATSLNNLGLVYYGQCKYKQAEEHFLQALKLCKNNPAQRANSLGNLAMLYHRLSRLDKGVQLYKEVLKTWTQLGQKNKIASSLNSLGVLYLEQARYDRAYRCFIQSLKLGQKLGVPSILSQGFNSLGSLYRTLGRSREALESFQKAIDLHKKLANPAGVACALQNKGDVYTDFGQYDRALVAFQEALTINQKLGNSSAVSACFLSIGGVYQAWGKFDYALRYYQKSLKIRKALGETYSVADSLGYMGTLYCNRGQYDRAFEYFTKALSVFRKLKKPSALANTLNNLGNVAFAKKKYQDALQYFLRARDFFIKLNQQSNTAFALTNIGGVYYSWGKYKLALNVAKKALALRKKLGEKKSWPNSHLNISSIYSAMGNLDKAIYHNRQAIQYLEEIRGTIGGNYRKFRRDYLAQQRDMYTDLIELYGIKGDVMGLLQTVEQSKAKYLLEQMGQKILKGSSGLFSFNLKDIQHQLSPFQMIIFFVNLQRNRSFRLMITKKNVMLSRFYRKGESAVKGFSPDTQKVSPLFTRGLKVDVHSSGQTFQIKWRDQKQNQENLYQLNSLVNRYRSILQNPGLRAKKQVFFQNLSRQLYLFLFGPIQRDMAQIKELIVIPEDSLYYLPMETLIDPQGQFLAEKYKISYVQSLGVWQLIGKRRSQTPTPAKTLLAFGGAQYEKIPSSKKVLDSPGELLKLKIQVWQGLSKNPDLNLLDTYKSMNYTGWEPLPATALEIRDIQKIVPGSLIFSGSQASESRIKQLSRSGVLKQYRILHFATHGLAVPEFPELSALVLSQFRKPGKEDGYLRMGEIARLKLRADFVNLSACETGLGKIYGGEGVVGLTQAFLIAGANGLSVSLWQVADESTRIFMVEFYRLVFQKKMAYRDAMVEVKRKFIRGDFGEKYKAPFFWAPFVYYGR